MFATLTWTAVVYDCPRFVGYRKCQVISARSLNPAYPPRRNYSTGCAMAAWILRPSSMAATFDMRPTSTIGPNHESRHGAVPTFPSPQPQQKSAIPSPLLAFSVIIQDSARDSIPHAPRDERIISRSEMNTLGGSYGRQTSAAGDYV